MIDIEATSPSDGDARRLLSEYAGELQERLVDRAAGLDREWSEGVYGGPRARVAVARLGGAAVGCIGLREHAPSAAEIKRVYVTPSARRSGVGRALLAWVERTACDLGYRRLILDTAGRLFEAAGLYETSGYMPIAAFNDNPHATHWFEKALPLHDAALWGAFRYSTLPAAEWTHRSHLRAAFLHVARWDLDEAHLRMRAGIIRLNATHGLEETPARGYHETLTRVWLALIAHASAPPAAYPASEALLAAHPELLDKHLALRFYTRAHLMSPRARAIFVEPDLAPLPTFERV
jgi:GNAT superfamily N-acetyltransferase